MTIIIKKVLKSFLCLLRRNKGKTFLVIILFLYGWVQYEYHKLENCDKFIKSEEVMSSWRRQVENFSVHIENFKKEQGRYPKNKEDYANFYKNHKIVSKGSDHDWGEYIYDEKKKDFFIYIWNYKGGYCPLAASKDVYLYIYSSKRGWLRPVDGLVGGKNNREGKVYVTIKNEKGLATDYITIEEYINNFL